jgi:two-component system, cell cycle response regulator
MVRLLTRLVSGGSHRTRTACSLEEARRELAASPADLVLLDRVLPDGDGIELARELKSGDQGNGCYVLMLSALDSERSKLDGFDGGADDYVTKPFAADELLARVRAGLRIVALQKELVASNHRLELLATTDALTGMRNRRWFDGELDRAFAHAIRYDRPLSLIMIDVDHFKPINDHFGHISGDSVLRDLSRAVAEALRKSDSVARVGGEEFAILLPETALFEGLHVAEKLRATVAATKIETGRGSIQPTISAGVASIPHTRLDHSSQLVWCADQALYRAKNRGRDRVEFERRSVPWRGETSVADQRAQAGRSFAR